MKNRHVGLEATRRPRWEYQSRRQQGTVDLRAGRSMPLADAVRLLPFEGYFKPVENGGTHGISGHSSPTANTAS
jgi:hypothetical protein